MNKFLFSFLTLLLVPTSFASAHVKWFAEESTPVRPYSLTDFPVLFAIVAVIIIVCLGFYLEKKLPVFTWFRRLIERIAPEVLSIASIGFGLSFLIFSFNGFIFAPNLLVTDATLPLLWLQGIAGLMILLGFYERIGGLLLVILFGFAIQYYGWGNMMDTLEMLGFALYAMIIGRPLWKIAESAIFSKIVHKLHQYGVSLLRVGTGLNLMILGFSEKIMAPSLTQDFLMRYDWNFMQNMGMTWFTDYWFAFAAGVVEALFGLFFLLGLITRVSILALAVFLVTTLALLGPLELMGHLPHFSIACVLLVFGAGSRLHQK